MRAHTCVVAVTIHAMLFGPLALANETWREEGRRDAAALNRVLQLGAAEREASAMTRQQFEERRTAVLQAIDDQIGRIESSRMDDEAFRKRLLRRYRSVMKKLSNDTAGRIRQTLSADQADAVLGEIRGLARYEDQIAMYGAGRDAVAACVRADLHALASAAERKWQHYGKADFVRDLRARRAALTAMTYDEGRYDEFFEGCWRLLASRDAIEMLALPIIFILDVVCIPFVIWIKIINYWWPEE